MYDNAVFAQQTKLFCETWRAPVVHFILNIFIRLQLHMNNLISK